MKKVKYDKKKKVLAGVRMSFYVLSNGTLSSLTFDYLENPGGSRLDPTLSPSNGKGITLKNKPDSKERAKEVFAVEVMSSPVITLDFESLTKDALEKFKENSIHHIVLTHNDKVKGMVSDRDLSWLKKFKLDEHAMVSQFMTSLILACHEETPIDHLARVMVREHISALPVVNSKKELTGIVTHHDLLKWIFN